MNDKLLPMFMRQFGATATDKLFEHESYHVDKVPADQTYQQESGVYEVYEYESKPPVPNRNQRPARGRPYERTGLQGFDRHSINPYSSTERLLKDQTFVDGYPRSNLASESAVRKDKLEGQLKKIDSDISKLNEILEDIDDLKEPEEHERVQRMIKELKNQKNEIQHAINPNFKIEQGIQSMVKLFEVNNVQMKELLARNPPVSGVARRASISTVSTTPLGLASIASSGTGVTGLGMARAGVKLITSIEELADKLASDFPTKGGAISNDILVELGALQDDFKDGSIDRDAYNDGLKDLIMKGTNDYNGIVEDTYNEIQDELGGEMKDADDSGMVGADILLEEFQDAIKNLDKTDPKFLNNYADILDDFQTRFDNLKAVALATKAITPTTAKKASPTISKKSMASTGSTIMSFLSSFYADVEDKKPIDDIEYGDSEYKDLLDEPLSQLSNNDNMKELTKKEAGELLTTFDRISVPSGKGSTSDKLKYDKIEALLKLAKSQGGDKLVKQKIYQNVLNSKGTKKGGLPKAVKKQVSSVIVSSFTPTF
jgi:hypothetical protein